MKQRLSSLDIRAISNELSLRLTGKYIQNFYTLDQRFMYIKFSTKDILLIEPGMRLHLTAFHDTEISHFCKKLRKTCGHSRVQRIYQYGFDRVVIIDIKRFRIVVEFFSCGNILILDEDDMIVDLLRPVPEIGIVKDTKYVWNVVELDLTFDKFVAGGLEAILPFEREFINTVAAEIGHRHGPIEQLKDESHRKVLEGYFEELGERIESLRGFGEVTISKKKPEQFFAFPTEVDAYKLLRTEEKSSPPIEKLSMAEDAKGGAFKLGESNIDENKLNGSSENKISKNMPDKNNLIIDKPTENASKDENSTENNDCHTAFDIKLWDAEYILNIIKTTKNIKALHFPSCNEAAEFAFLGRRKAPKTAKTADGKGERIKQAQLRYVEELEQQAETYAEIAAVIEQNRKFVGEILSIFKKVYESKMKWEIFVKFFEEEKRHGNPHSLAIASYDLHRRIAVICIAGCSFELLLDRSLSLNIDHYYARRKKALDKCAKTRVAMENIITKLCPKKKTVKAQKREPYWFERYHFFVSSDGSLVIGGKNAQENEIIVKNRLEKNDLYFHCDVHGASSVICKGRSEATLAEASYMALCYSKCWEEGVVRRVFYVEPPQVSKAAPSGEYLARGGFLITGSKTYIDPYKLEYGLGLLFKEEGAGLLEFTGMPTGRPIEHAMPVAAPWMVAKNYKYRIRLCPGGEKKSQIAQHALKTFHDQAEGSGEEAFVKAVGIDEYINVVLGKAKVAKIVK